VEALRPLWGDSSLGGSDLDPTVDLTVRRSGPSHEFALVANAACRQIRLYSQQDGFLASTGRAGAAPGETLADLKERAQPLEPFVSVRSPLALARAAATSRDGAVRAQTWTTLCGAAA